VLLILFFTDIFAVMNCSGLGDRYYLLYVHCSDTLHPTATSQECT